MCSVILTLVLSNHVAETTFFFYRKYVVDIIVQQSIGKFHKQMHIYDDLGGMKPALAVMR